MKKSAFYFLFIILLFVDLVGCTQSKDEWTQLFNGKDLTGWTPKIRGYPAGENFGNTFRVEDGIMKVSYDQYDKFDLRLLLKVASYEPVSIYAFSPN